MAQIGDTGGDRLFTGLPPTHRKVAAWSATVLLALGVAAFIVWVVVVLRAATVPFVLALLGTALLQPLMPWLMKRGASRALASGLTCAGLAVQNSPTASVRWVTSCRAQSTACPTRAPKSPAQRRRGWCQD